MYHSYRRPERACDVAIYICTTRAWASKIVKRRACGAYMWAWARARSYTARRGNRRRMNMGPRCRPWAEMNRCMARFLHDIFLSSRIIQQLISSSSFCCRNQHSIPRDVVYIIHVLQRSERMMHVYAMHIISMVLQLLLFITRREEEEGSTW